MTFEIGLEFVASFVASVFGCFGSVMVLKNEKKRVRNDHCSYLLHGALCALILLQVTSTIERGRLYITNALPDSFIGYIAPTIAMVELQTVLIYVAMLAFTSFYEIRHKRVLTRAYKIGYFAVAFVIIFFMFLAEFLVTTPQNFIPILQLGVESTMSAAAGNAVWLKYGTSIILILYILILSGLALFTDSKTEEGKVPRSYAVYTLILGCMFTPIMVNGLYFASSKDKAINGFIAALECICTLISGFVLAVSFRDPEEVAELKEKKGEEDEEKGEKGDKKEKGGEEESESLVKKNEKLAEDKKDKKSKEEKNAEKDNKPDQH